MATLSTGPDSQRALLALAGLAFVMIEKERPLAAFAQVGRHSEQASVVHAQPPSRSIEPDVSMTSP